MHARPSSSSSLRQGSLRRGAVCTASYPARPNYVGNGPPMTEKEYSRIHLFVKSKKYAQKRKFIKYLFSIFIRPVRMINSFDFSGKEFSCFAETILYCRRAPAQSGAGRVRAGRRAERVCFPGGAGGLRHQRLSAAGLTLHHCTGADEQRLYRRHPQHAGHGAGRHGARGAGLQRKACRHRRRGGRDLAGRQPGRDRAAADAGHRHGGDLL